MQRRARIKAVANLSSVRRGASKNNLENQSENEKAKKEPSDVSSNDIPEKSSNIDEQQQESQEVAVAESSKETAPNVLVEKDDDVNKVIDLLEKVDEKPNESDESNKQLPQQSPSKNSETEKQDKCVEEKFKAPVNAAPRAEKEIVASNKFRKPKITPRLNISRAVQPKAQEADENPKKNDVIIDSPLTSPVHQSFEKPPESPINVFSPPSAPFSPSPRTPRSETPRDLLDSPGFIINHNVHHPPTPQSPFYPISHPRIRTESLCSIKSTTVANLQPRKKVRTEDQKILDNKRESRERLSNKKIEKSQLRMFDLIYFNPTTNPIKPKPPPSKEKSPKKIDLTMELPPSPKEPSTTIAVPQLKLNADGELVLDEASLVVENEEQKKNRILLANTNVVYHDELSGSYGYYKRQQRTKEWPQEETIKFYRCLNTVGTDFSLMLNLFPNRSRRDLKLKFKKEEKNNPHLVDKALLNHNTFDIEELQKELDEEDEMRRKEAESKTSEVKELVKRKILKKQEAKAKARQQDKAKIEKILSDGDLILETVDNPKENLEKAGLPASKRKRNNKRKNIKPEPNMEFKKIILSTKSSSISVEELISPIEMSSSTIFEPPLIPKEPREPKAAIIISEMQSESDSNSLVPLNSIESFNQSESSDIEPLGRTKIEKDSSSANIVNVEVGNQDTMLSKTGKFLSDVITASYHENHENENDYMIDNNHEEENSGCDLINVKKEEPKQRQTIREIPPEPRPIESNKSMETTLPVPSTCTSDLPATNSEPTLLYDNSACFDNPSEISCCPSMFSELPSFNPSIDEKDFSLNTISMAPSYDTSVILVEPTNQSITSLSPYDNRITQVEPIEQAPGTPLDDESFLNSLDLERLAIVVKTVDGKDIYDIHETDAVSQELSDKPLNLPRHIIDLIVSAMAQDD